jgi:drug/metabolite transporter (DMT)-like permease
VNRPIILLIGTGTALGFNFPLGKLAILAGLHPVLWAAFICLGAGLTMSLASRLVEGPSRDATPWRYAATSGFLSYVVPHALTYLAIPRIGSGLASIADPAGAPAEPARRGGNCRGPPWRPGDHPGAR